MMIPVDIEPLAEYALTITACQATSRGVYWTGDLYHNGTKVACIENMGDGGPDRITEPDTGRWISNEWLTNFRAAANTAFGRPNNEAWEDMAIIFLDAVAQLG